MSCSGSRRGRGGGLVIVLVEGAPPDDRPDAGEQEQHARHRPEDVRARRTVADQRLVRPVVGVGDLHPRPIGRAGPARPEEEMCERLESRRIADHDLLHGVVQAERVQRRIPAEEADVVSSGRGHRLGAVLGDRERAGRGVVAVRAHLSAEALQQSSLQLRGELRIRPAGLTHRPEVEQCGRLAVQPVGRPVGRLVGAVAPDGAELLAARALPDLLSVEDLLAGHQEAAARRHDLLGQGRRLAVDLSSEETEQHERPEDGGAENEPELPVARHFESPRTRAVRAGRGRCSRGGYAP